MKENGKSGLRAKCNTLFKKMQRSGEPLWFYKTVGSRFARAGVPDFLICYYGRFLAIELKQEGERPTPLQSNELEAIEAAYGVARVCFSVDDVILALDGIRPDPEEAK